MVGALLAVLGDGEAGAVQYFGRIMTGSYVSQERFSDPIDGTTANDFATLSSRFYLKASDISSRDLELTTDARDKHDFFDKLSAERLQLDSRNTFQLYQLNVRSNNPRGAYFGGVGRLLVMDAGNVAVDGGDLGYRWSHTTRSGAFAGLNPRRNDQAYFTFNPDSLVGGGYLTYQPKGSPWSQNVFMTQALIAERVQSHLDRLYYFNNFIRQWSADSRVVGTLYLDFVPRVNIQNGFLTYNQAITPVLNGTLTATAIDSVQYSRRQNVLTLLAPSTYREGNAQLNWKLNPRWSFLGSVSYGARGADGLKFGEVLLGPTSPSFFDPKVSAGFLLGGRHNFNTNDVFARLDLGYFAKLWEIGLVLQKGLSVQHYGVIYHPFTGEVSLAHYFSRDIYGTVSLEEAMNERVTIWSGFVKVGYRFGTNDVAPLRDGQPPRRRL